MLFASCGSLQGFEKRKYRPGFFVNVQSKKTVEQTLTSHKPTTQRVLRQETVMQISSSQNALSNITTVKKNKTEANEITVTELNEIAHYFQSDTLITNLSKADIKKAKTAKGWAITALVLCLFIPYLALIPAIIAYSMGKKLLVNHKYEPEWAGRKDAKFAFRTGKVIMIVALLLAAFLTIELTIGICQFLLFILGVPVC